MKKPAPLGVEAAAPAHAAESTPSADLLLLFLLKPWTTGTGHTYPAHVAGEPPLEFEFANLPDGVTAGAFDYLIATGAAESAAMRAARR